MSLHWPELAGRGAAALSGGRRAKSTPAARGQPEREVAPGASPDLAGGGFCGEAFQTGARQALAQRYAACLAELEGLPPDVRWVDSHCHLESTLNRTWYGAKKRRVKADEPAWSLEELVAQWPRGLSGCICNCVFPAQWAWLEQNLHHFEAQGGRSARLWFTVGLHPHAAREWGAAVEAKLRRLSAHPGCVGIGECGLDAKAPGGEEVRGQLPAFQQQAELAVELGKALVVHMRNAEEPCREVLGRVVPEHHPVHMHCFAGSVAAAEAMSAHWPLMRFGIAGHVTYPEAAEVAGRALALPLERLLLETDGPYLAPVPFRGQTSHSGLVHLVAQRIAGLKGLPLEQVLRVTRGSTAAVYGV